MRLTLESRKTHVKARRFVKKHRGLFEAIILIGLAYLASYGLWFGLRAILGSESPISPVTGNSMIDKYYEGDLVIVQGVTKDQIAIHDVITFHEPGDWDHIIIHRVIDKAYTDDEIYFLTKGDNNQSPDPGNIWPTSATPYQGWLPADHIVGRVIFRVPFLGWPLLIMQGYPGKAVTILLIIIILILSLRRERKDNHSLSALSFNYLLRVHQ